MKIKFNGKHSAAFKKINKKYQFRFNIVTANYEFRKRKGGKWREYEDRDKNVILIDLMAQNIIIPTEVFNMFVESKQISPDYDPFKDYFEELPKWDGKTDYIKKICKTLQPDDEKLFRSTFKRFMVGTIDCLLHPDKVNDVCLVFQSPQGVGKSRWMRSLLPKRFQSKYLYEGAIDTRKNDHVLYLSQYWFIHLDELESLRNNDISALKSYITRQRISLRRAYGRYKAHYVRRASFLGSVNEDKFLSDITGNRRWLVFKVKQIDYQHKVDPDKLWAQAYYYYKQGFKHWFDIQEIKGINRRNEAFRNKNTEEELFLKLFIPHKKEGGKAGFYSSSDVCQEIMQVMPQFTNKINTMRMGKVLSRHCANRKITKGVWEYCCEFVPPASLNGQHPASGSEIDEKDDLPF